MVIVRLQGGLGNQLFQYSTGRALSEFNRQTLKLDLSWYITRTDRLYRLENFNIPTLIANNEDIDNVIFGNSKGIYRKLFMIIQKLLPNWSRRISSESLNLNQFNRIRGKKHLYLMGYWQSELYFREIRDILIRELQVSHPPDEVNRDYLDTIKASNAVSVHVRRGDYVSNTSTFMHHGVCSVDYYQQAGRLMSSQITSPTFFVFSDDIHWSVENISFDYPTVFIDHNDEDKDYEDLR
ncbi:MAG: alpha-1,2-fucosyltransferase, partial [Nitrosopumilales archaeon]